MRSCVCSCVPVSVQMTSGMPKCPCSRVPNVTYNLSECESTLKGNKKCHNAKQIEIENNTHRLIN